MSNKMFFMTLFSIFVATVTVIVALLASSGYLSEAMAKIGENRDVAVAAHAESAVEESSSDEFAKADEVASTPVKEPDSSYDTDSYANKDNIWDISAKYTWGSKELEDRSKALADKYDYVFFEEIGKSVEGRKIYSLVIGSNADEMMKYKNRERYNVEYTHVLFSAGTHAREHMNPFMLYQIAENYAKDVSGDSVIKEYSIKKEIIDENMVYHFILCVNPDGIDYAKFNGARNLKENRGKFANYTSLKSNMNGVDLNRNFPSEHFSTLNNKWLNPGAGGTASKLSPGLKGYSKESNSEPETQAVVDYVKDFNFKGYVSFHSAGRLVCWQSVYMNGDFNYWAKALARKTFEITGYPAMAEVPKNSSIPTSYETDYFIFTTNKPALTIETLPGTSYASKDQYASETYNRKLWKVPFEFSKMVKTYPIGRYKLYIRKKFIRDFVDRNVAYAYADKLGGVIVEYDGPPKSYDKVKEKYREAIDAL